jgi:hypothetical protein
MLRDQRLELADQLRVAAEREVGLDPLLDDREPEILQPPCLHLRRSAPELERPA